MCIFCQIAEHRQKAEVVFEDGQMIVFRDINPKAPVHLLIVPKKHIDSINHLQEQDRDLVNQMIFLAKKMAREQKVENGYKLLFNVGRKGGQLVDHLHLHLLGGGDFKE